MEGGREKREGGEEEKQEVAGGSEWERGDGEQGGWEGEENADEA
jgi:hypothetical protein